ncbi:hypothetical protein U14_02961 [Candidatus Moduliflexus flocculans]|uniref:Glycosyl transferase n=1 Tax=Candidatus Moduliflexus flocculans TaxID=1499966 RepID=A0A081BMV0_9BACT|nr:hypothetical protein U14_02961 [Candidatus Moduliflexus flocculans]
MAQQRYFVTLFDSNYLTRGLTMYRSLAQHCGEFHLWIICFDNFAYHLLSAMRLPQVTLVPLATFEDAELLRVKPQRSFAEYCWTSTPSVLLYVLNAAPDVDAITYLDADLKFYAPLQPIFDEMGTASILLTEHRYPPHTRFDLSATHGRYNVQFMTFRRNPDGIAALHWWRERCLEWCFNRLEDGKFGDQKYLDDWPQRFANVHCIQHIGAGVAPWNVSQYRLEVRDETLYVDDMPLIFYHFHHFKLYHTHLAYCYSVYPLVCEIWERLYLPYIQDMRQAAHDVATVSQSVQVDGAVRRYDRWPSVLNMFAHPGLWYCLIRDVLEGRYAWI